MSRGIFWPGDVPAERLAIFKTEFERVAAVPYDRVEVEKNIDYWRRAIEFWAQGRGDCEDHAIALLDAVLIRREMPEALRLVVVDSTGGSLGTYAGVVDGEYVQVPKVDHACCLWLPDVDSQLSGDAYLSAWTLSRRLQVDPTWNEVMDWRHTGFRRVWSWGLEGNIGVWRKHFVGGARQ